MKVHIENIGNISKSDIEIEGITVVAGRNGSGKSTLSKSIFSIFNSFYNLYEKIEMDKLSSIYDILFHQIPRTFNSSDNATAKTISRTTLGIREDIRNTINLEFVRDANSLDIINQVNDIFAMHNLSQYMDTNILQEELDDILNQSDKSIIDQLINTNFQDEFNDQISNISNPKHGVINVSLNERTIKLGVDNDSVSLKSEPFELMQDVVYIDDPGAIIDNRRYRFIRLGNDHQGHLSEQIKGRYRWVSNTLKAVSNAKLKEIFKIINSTLETVEKPVSGEKKLNVANYSSGMKSFYVIKTLIERDVIKRNGLLILDEPEVHLHPEWQVKFAELIILLQKEFDLHILINTHSPYILNALEVYSRRYKVSEVCNYYISDVDDVDLGYATITKVEDTEDIYDALAAPLQRVQDIEDSLDD